MNKAAPSFGRIAAMVVFALSCFGLLLFLWLAFGGPIPLKPQGYRFQTSFAEATQLANEADVRISGVPGRAASRRSSPTRDGPLDRGHRAAVALRADARPTRGRSCARRRCWARPTSSSRRAAATPSRSPEGGSLPRVADLRHGRSSTRSSAPSTPRRARRSRPGCRSRRAAIGGYGRDLNDALGNLGAVRRGRRRAGATSSTARRAPSRSLISQHRRGVRGADRARRPAALADRELQPRLPGHRVARRAAQGDVHRAADLRARVRADARAPGRVRRRHRPADHPAAARGARAEPDAAGPRRAGARPRGAVPRARPADRRLGEGHPGRRAGARGRAAADRPARPGAAPARPDRRLPRPLQARAHRVLRQHARPPRRRTTPRRRSTTCARPTR